jgi:branched-subunit amino acid ABC-type transport system permease component
VGEFFSYALPNIPFGCTYALVAVGLVLTYRATGVFNFGFAAEAYAAGVIYSELYWHGMQRTWAALVVVFVVAPIFGALLDIGLFSRIPTGNLTAKIVTSLGVMVVLPTVVSMFLGQVVVYAPPAPLFVQGPIWTIGSVTVNGPELCTIVATIAVLVGLSIMLRTRRFGLPIRAAVESPKLLELAGVNSKWVLRAAWMISTSLAALAGVLYAASSITLDPNAYGVLLVAAIAAAAIAGLKSIPWAVAAGILLGVIQGVESGYIPTDTVWYQALVPSLPFFILLVVLIVHPAFRHLDDAVDPMAAIEPPPPAPALSLRPPQLNRTIRRWRWPLFALILALILATVPSLWMSSLTLGASYSIIFLSITLLTGLAGQLSLAQAAFAGIGACTVAQLTYNQHTPVLLAALAGAAIAGLGGWLASLPALRLRGLPIALLTLCLALLADNLLFPTSWIGGGPSGLPVPRPTVSGINFAGADSKPFFLLLVFVLLGVGGMVQLLLRGTTGRALAAVHASPIGSASAGVPVRRMTMLVFALSAAIAGLGGAFFAMSLGQATPTDYNWFFGPTFLVIVVTVGATTVEGAIGAGMAFALITQALTYLPSRVGGTSAGGASLTVLLLSLGAFTYASHPEGIVEYLKRQAMGAIFKEHRVGAPLAAPLSSKSLS